MKKYIKGIAAFVIAEALACAAIAFGTKLRGQIPWAGAAAVVLGLILAAVMICNVLTAIRLHGRVRTKDVQHSTTGRSGSRRRPRRIRSGSSAP